MLYDIYVCGELLILAESTTRYTREGNGDEAG